MDFKYQVSAELYYDTTGAMSSTSNNAWQTQYAFGNNGDGSIWYPGKPTVIGGTHDIPIESFRMKMLREGMQDYEYLSLLTKLGDGSFGQTELAKVVTAANGFTADPAVLEQARADMAQEIEKDLANVDAGSGAASTCDAGGAVTDASAPNMGVDGGAPEEGGSGGRSAGRDATVPNGSGDNGAGDHGSGAATPGSSNGCGCTLANESPWSPWALIGVGAIVGMLVGRRTREVPERASSRAKQTRDPDKRSHLAGD